MISLDDTIRDGRLAELIAQQEATAPGRVSDGAQIAPAALPVPPPKAISGPSIALTVS